MTSDPPIPSPTERLQTLRHQLEAHPDDGWFWLWRIHARVSRYLLGGSEPPSPEPPPEAVSRNILSDLRDPYVTVREPTAEELRLRALSRVKAARLMRDMQEMGPLGPQVQADAGAAEAREQRFQRRYDTFTRIAWRFLGMIFVVMFAPLLIGSFVAVLKYAPRSFTEFGPYERVSLVLILFGLATGPPAIVYRAIRPSRRRRLHVPEGDSPR